jgi:hypothetical protein
MTANCLTLTKFQQREVNTALARLPVLGADYAARAISALYRAAMRDTQKRELLSIALAYRLVSSPDWIA